jgi:WD40 repeat protein
MDELTTCTAGAISPFAKLTAFGFSDGSIRLYTSAPENSVVTLYWHRLPVMSLDFGLIGGVPVLASAGADNLALIWRPSNTDWRPADRIHFDDECTSVSFSKDGSSLAIALASGAVDLYDITGNKGIRAIQRFSFAGPVAVGWLPVIIDRLVVGERDGSISIFSVGRGTVKTWKNPSCGRVLSIAVSRTGIIAALLENGIIKLIQDEPIGKIQTMGEIVAVDCFWQTVTEALCVVGDRGEMINWMRVGEETWKKVM